MFLMQQRIDKYPTKIISSSWKKMIKKNIGTIVLLEQCLFWRPSTTTMVLMFLAVVDGETKGRLLKED